MQLTTMSRNTSLFLRIGEAKNLPAKDISGFSDPYCVIKVDNEQVARTATVWRSLNPFWGEEYTLHLPNGFTHLDIYVFDQDIVSGDDIIGKVTLSRNVVQGDPKGLERWFKICHVDEKKETEGEIHLQLGNFLENGRNILRIKVLEARDLAVKDIGGSSDPYVKLSFLDQQKQTVTIRGSLYPTWNEVFEFEVPRMSTEVADAAKVTLNVWDWDRMASDDFMGKVEIMLGELEVNQPYDQWFFLQPRDEKDTVTRHDAEEDNGTIRVRARLMEERILPSEHYQPLVSLLMDSVATDKHKMTGPTPLKMLQEVMTLDLMEVASTLVKLYLGQGKIQPYLDVVCIEEIHNTGNPNTLFRGNSLATKSMDQFMKIVGMPYLHETLGPVIDHIYDDHKIVELDPSRLELIRRVEYGNFPSGASARRPSLKSIPKDKEIIDQSVETLLTYLNAIKQRILSSVSRIPPIMRVVFKRLRQRIEERWPGPEYEDHKYVGISGFLFLRFLAPATLSPKLFNLRDLHPDARTSRTLTLLAKTVQNMGNLGLQVGKEQWMEPLTPFIKESVGDIKHFINELVDIGDNTAPIENSRRRSVFHPSVTIKQGYLWKRRWDCVKLMTAFTFQKRYFWLKYDTLAYAKKPNDQVRNNIPISNIRAVERVEKHAFSRANMGQIITYNSQGHLEVIYFQAKDINEMYSWISSIRKTVILNDNLLETYHPAIYSKDKWTCCSRPGKDARGCSRTHSRVTIGDWRDPLDPDAEAQTIYSQLYQGRDILRQKYLESQEAVQEVVKETVLNMKEEQRRERAAHQEQLAQNQLPNSHLDPPPLSPMFLMIATDSNQGLHKSTSFQDAKMASVAQLLDVVRDLEKAHEAYEKMEKEQARGSICRGDMV